MICCAGIAEIDQRLPELLIGMNVFFDFGTKIGLP